MWVFGFIYIFSATMYHVSCISGDVYMLCVLPENEFPESKNLRCNLLQRDDLPNPRTKQHNSQTNPIRREHGVERYIMCPGKAARYSTMPKHTVKLQIAEHRAIG